MTWEQGPGSGDVRPFGEPPSPPFVVLGNRVKLREVEGDQASLECHAQTSTCLWRVDAANRLEISKPVLQIRLQVIPLRPLVPRIDEDQAVVGRATAHGTRGVGQARLEALWRRVDDDDAVRASPWAVVPRHEDTGIHGEVSALLLHGAASDAVVVYLMPYRYHPERDVPHQLRDLTSVV